MVTMHRQGRSFMELGKETGSGPDIGVQLGEEQLNGPRDAAAGRRSQLAQPKSDQAKIRRLERELAHQEQELEILGKALAFFARRMDR